MKIITILFITIFSACTKQQDLPPTCTPVLIVSDKYTIDTIYIKTDTVYKDCLSGHWLQVFFTNQDTTYFKPCNINLPFRLEQYRYAAGSQIQTSKPYKK